MDHNNREDIVHGLEEHFRHNWLFEAMKRKNQIKFEFKQNKSQVHGRIYLDENRVLYNLYDEEFSYEYLEEAPIEEDFLCAFFVHYPHNRGHYHHFDDWIQEWLKDRRKRNKRAHQLYGYEK